MIRYLSLVLLVSSFACNRGQEKLTDNEFPIAEGTEMIASDSLLIQEEGVEDFGGKGALLLTSFQSLEQLKRVVQIRYPQKKKNTQVSLIHKCSGGEVQSILTAGVSQKDFERARDSGFQAKAALLLKSPYSIWHRADLRKAYALSRRRGGVFGEGDVAFYDFAVLMRDHILEEDKAKMRTRDLGDKGYINTFNHIVAQAFITSIFSEELADFIADSHERLNMPELTSGDFSEDQLKDLDNGPMDNFVDMINNEWGQELGKMLKAKYGLSRKTVWTPELLQNYLNDHQAYFSWAFQIGFEPIKASDPVIIRFIQKIQIVMGNAPDIQ